MEERMWVTFTCHPVWATHIARANRRFLNDENWCTVLSKGFEGRQVVVNNSQKIQIAQLLAAACVPGPRDITKRASTQLSDKGARSKLTCWSIFPRSRVERNSEERCFSVFSLCNNRVHGAEGKWILKSTTIGNQCRGAEVKSLCSSHV